MAPSLKFGQPRVMALLLALTLFQHPIDIQMLYGELLNRSLPARSIRHPHAVLRSALKQAVRCNLILANPADLLDLPRQDSDVYLHVKKGLRTV
jgi:hypothetical protein